MADDIERLVLEMSADLKRFDKGLERAQKLADRRLRGIEQRFSKAEKMASASMGRLGSNVNQIIAGIAVGAAIREVGQYADAWTRAGNQLAAAGVPAGDLLRVQRELVQLANDSRAALEPTIALYSRMTRTLGPLGASQEQIARATEIVNRSFVAGGAAASEQAAGILQLTQALGSGILQGDELRSLRENAPLLAQAIADEFGTTIGGLKELGAEGKLTVDRVFAAILRGGAAIDAQFARTTPTIADSFTRLRNEAILFIGNLDEATGASEKLGQFIVYVAENLDTLAAAAVVCAAVIGGVLAGQAVVLLIANLQKGLVTLGITRAAIEAVGLRAALAAGGVNALKAALAFFGGPIGIAVTAVAIAFGLMAANAARNAAATGEMRNRVSAAAAALDEQAAAAARARQETGDLTPDELEAATAAASLSGQTHLLADAHYRAAAAAKAHRIEEARLAEEVARNDFIRAQRDVNRERTQERRRAVGPRSSGDGRQPLPAGLEEAANSVAESRISRESQEALTDAARVYRAAFRRRVAIERSSLEDNLPPTIRPPASDSGGGGGGGRSGPTIDQIERAAVLEALRLGHNEDLVQALEDQVYLERQIKEYADAGASAADAEANANRDLLRIQTERLAAQEEERAILEERVAIMAASAAEDYDTVRILEDQAELRALVRDYQATSLDLAEATARAESRQAELQAGREEGYRRAIADRRRSLAIEVAAADLEFDQVRALERQEALEEGIRFYQENGRNLVVATAEATADLLRLEQARYRERQRFLADEEEDHRRRLAELDGEERTAARIARAQEVRNRARRYADSGGMSGPDAQARAAREVYEETYASARAAFREGFTSALVEGIESGDVLAAAGDLALELAGKLTDQVLGRAADVLFDTLAELFPSLFDLGQELLTDTTAAATMGTAITTAGATAGATIGASLTAAAPAAGTAAAVPIITGITTGAATAGQIMAAAIVAGGGQAAATMAAAIASAGAVDGAGKAISSFAAAFAGGRAGGGGVMRGRQYLTQERGPEPFVPTSNGVVFSTQAMRGLANLGKLAAANQGLGGDLNITVENKLGVKAKAEVERTPDGAHVTLQPAFEKALEGSGRSGALGRAAKKDPRPRKRG